MGLSLAAVHNVEITVVNANPPIEIAIMIEVHYSDKVHSI